MECKTILSEIRIKSFVPKQRVLHKINSYGKTEIIVLLITVDRDVCLWCEVTNDKNETNKFLLEKVYQGRYPDKTIKELFDIASRIAHTYQQWLRADKYPAAVLFDNYPEYRPFEIL